MPANTVVSTKPSTIARELMGDIAPKFAELTDTVLFDDIWQRPGLATRERSLITVASLIALNRSEQLPFHLQRALDNGVTHAELVEVMTHLAFYAGWPTAASAVTALRQLAPNQTIVKE
ncbi:carboxymuconolactone decarboxylase family protein [Undibacterium sp. TS12]|uniref:carboxymuconolactone decarboxylase family protein n=1 Tax=Undibacterium sp. TS12 TaxID=2908202 RepID=UPI001F4D074C|nr:carboxymuconolactone decarboxylase family protein [Undibacterium sp. TS12]MCH8622232.1 carboxymuconolactone decarboxylase family protein [Undibacterium sp. TS12]